MNNYPVVCVWIVMEPWHKDPQVVATQTFLECSPFTDPWGNDPIWRLHIFQMGWNNHQLDLIIKLTTGGPQNDGPWIQGNGTL